MVKDILRGIKEKWLQFFAILLITALGVGFFIGIRVTGYNMRLTADTYMEQTNSLDLQLSHTLGIDQEMAKELDTITKDKGHLFNEVDAYVGANDLDEVMKIYEYNESTKSDVTLMEGRLPLKKNEVLLDDFMSGVHKIPIGSKLKIKKNDVFKESNVEVVGIVKSNLYMNANRGKTTLGTGSIAGYMYANDLDVNNKDIYTSIRYNFNDETVDLAAYKKKLEKKSDEVSEHRFKRAIKPAEKKIAESETELKNKKTEVYAELDRQEGILNQSDQELLNAKHQLEAGIRELSFGIPLSGSLDDQLAMIKGGSDRITEIGNEAVAAIKRALSEVEDSEIKAGLIKELQTQEQKVLDDTKKFNDGYQQLSAGVADYNNGLTAVTQGRQTLADARVQADQEFASADKELANAKKELKKANHGSLFVFERKDVIIGYTEFYNDSERIEAIGKVFPLIFFGVAILVTLSTVSRMIDESRMQIGVYKALGYTWFQSSLKYVGFTGLAWFIGALIGVLMGFYFYPNIIYDAYRIMYTTPDMITGIVWDYVWLPILISFLSSVGVAFFKARQVSKENAANLLRPPMPKAGQRIFLEKITPLWDRLSFLYKVSLRNLFRNKARFFMTVLGIGGCCGLLITGFGLKHSIYSIIDNTFENIIAYDGLMVYQENAKLDDELMDEYLDIRTDNIDVKNEEVILYSTDDLDELNHYIHMNDYKTRELFDITSDPVLISEKLASNNNVGVGDELEFEYNNKAYQLTVGGIVENYAAHYIYMSDDSYEEIFGTTRANNTRLFNFSGESKEISEHILENEEVFTVNLLQDIEQMFDDMLGNFDIIIYVVVGAAFALELIVLLNLISMNMSERQKELATLKVLGFYPKELAQYLLRENIILTVISLIFGVVFGKFLHYFVVSTAELDLVLFNKELLFRDIGLAMLLTFVISILINLMMARKANKVNMSEALKTFDD